MRATDADAAFTKLVGCERPLQLAGMGDIGGAVDLPVAVTEAGGLGMIGAAGLPAARLVELLVAAAEATAGPIGVNFLMPFLDEEAVVEAARRCRVVELFYGAPDPSLVDLVHEGGALACWQVGSLAEALAAVGAGCDLVVAQGVEAGGHVRGVQSLARLLAEVVPAVPVPVLAAGGIGSAAAVTAAVAAGAAGVRVGTRFVAAHESVAHPDYVAALVAAGADDTVLTGTFSEGWPDAPHRVLRTCVEAARATGAAGFSTAPPTTGLRGSVTATAMYAGTSVGDVRGRASAREVVVELLG